MRSRRHRRWPKRRDQEGGFGRPFVSHPRHLRLATSSGHTSPGAWVRGTAIRPGHAIIEKHGRRTVRWLPTGGRSDFSRRRFVGRAEADGPGARAVEHYRRPVVAICAPPSLAWGRPNGCCSFRPGDKPGSCIGWLRRPVFALTTVPSPQRTLMRSYRAMRPRARLPPCASPVGAQRQKHYSLITYAGVRATLASRSLVKGRVARVRNGMIWRAGGTAVMI
jgi:hypothetical protein